MSKTPEIMHEEGDVRIVKISQQFQSTNNTVDMFISTFTIDEIELLITDLHYASWTFRMSPVQMDNLFAAWTAYKEAQKARDIGERNQRVATEAEAYRLAADYPAIQVIPHTYTDGGHAWEISIPSMGWAYEQWQCTPDDFLAAVKTAVGVYEDHLKQRQ